MLYELTLVLCLKGGDCYDFKTDHPYFTLGDCDDQRLKALQTSEELARRGLRLKEARCDAK